MNPKLVVLGVGFLVAAIVMSSSLFTLNEMEQAIVTQFGDPKQIHQTPGLKFKIPFIQDVAIYDKRVLDLDPPVQQVILADQKRLDVDSFVRFRIDNPLKFFQSVGNEMIGQQRLNSLVNSTVRRIMGNVTLTQILSPERTEIMRLIHEQVDSEASKLGLKIVDVRIRRADLPSETSQAIFARMRSEREREAAEFRAEGQELNQQIKSEADRQRIVILADAQRQGEILRGEGDFEAFTLLAEKTSKNPEFYSFYRSLKAYRESLKPEDTFFILSPENDFFKYFNQSRAGK